MIKICDKMAISAYILKKSRKGPILRFQMRAENTFSCWAFRDPI